MSAYDKMSTADKVKKAHISFMRHKEFALLSGVSMVGTVTIDKEVPTAVTNGRDVIYGEEFINALNEKQLRYVVAHENFHKALRHCSPEYTQFHKEYPQHWLMATDFAVNALIEEMDPKFDFVERPTVVPPLVDPKYKGWSAVRILRDLLVKFPPPPPMGGSGNGKQPPGSGNSKQPPGNGGFDDHENQDGEGEGKLPQLSEAELKEVKRQIEDAVRQGELVRQSLAGNEKGGVDLSAQIQERDTNWKQYLREFVTQIVKGDDMSRFVPPNKRMLASGFIMPSHFSESTGELHLYCDTSGSMGWLYPILFGEVAQIVKDVKPERVRIIWWDTEVGGEQVFEPKDYDQIASLIQPKGGGGTTPNVVRPYVDKKGYKAKCGIWLTDGDFHTAAVDMPWPQLWGIYGNDNFTAAHGKVIHLTIPKD